MRVPMGGALCALVGAATALAQSTEPADPVRAISGAVYEDPDGDGDPVDLIAIPGVTVHLWRDGGDGLPDGVDDERVATTVTDAGFRFRELPPDATWWVSVDSRTIRPPGARGPVWPEQTWGGPGSLCHDPAGAAVERTDAPCFGGRSAAGDGDELAGAEHVARVVTDDDVHDLAFAFSARVVTRTVDADEDADLRRTAQGSLRQALANLARLDRRGAVRFVPTSPGPWIVRLGGDLVVPAGVLLDGAAWCDGSACAIGGRRDDNPDLLGSGEEVPRVAAPELELDGDGTWRVRIGEDGGLRAIALHRSGVVVDGDRVTVSDAVIGLRADGSAGPPLALPAVTVLAGADDVVVERALIVGDAPAIVQAGSGDRLTVRHSEIVGWSGLRPASASSADPLALLPARPGGIEVVDSQVVDGWREDGPVARIPDVDTDGDGLFDRRELELGTDHRVADTDHDGLPDGEELTVAGTDPLAADSDGGGVSDGDELLRDGTDPADPTDDLPRIPGDLDGDGLAEAPPARALPDPVEPFLPEPQQRAGACTTSGLPASFAALIAVVLAARRRSARGRGRGRGRGRRGYGTMTRFRPARLAR